MPNPIIILGGIDPFGRPVADFAVGDAHTLYEWAMVYEDRHPAALHPAHGANTAEDRHYRLEIVGENSIGRAVYDALAAEIAAGRILPRQRAHCAERPAELDPTLCIIDAAPVLHLARRRGDYGGRIAALLAREAAPVAKPRGGSKPAAHWGEARRVAMDWLANEGCPAPGDGQQAALQRHMAEWLQSRGRSAGEATIRRHVGRWIADRRAELGR